MDFSLENAIKQNRNYDFPNIKQWEIDHSRDTIHIHYLNGDKKILKESGEKVLFLTLWKIFVQNK